MSVASTTTDDSFASYSIGIGDLDDNTDLMAHAAAINSLMPIAAASTQTNANANVAATSTAAAGATTVAVNANPNVVASDEHSFASVSMLSFL